MKKMITNIGTTFWLPHAQKGSDLYQLISGWIDTVNNVVVLIIRFSTIK